MSVPALSVLSLALKLRFLRHVYDKGGSKDLKVAAEALARAHRSPVPTRSVNPRRIDVR
ncbi:hypothetical protein [Saccharopolyspora cebuensis]|uniref:Transposase n=1 Tax=Saccharopolyspora cebuensis TaxID=418759 RepID=A0ABV4CKN3_9PSEU